MLSHKEHLFVRKKVVISIFLNGFEVSQPSPCAEIKFGNAVILKKLPSNPDKPDNR